MKNRNYIINGVLIVAVIVLFILQFTGKRVNTNQSQAIEALTDSTGFRLPVAFVRTDSLMANYKFFIDLNEVQTKKVEDKRLQINQRNEVLQKNVVDFQQKARNNAFISQERMEQEQNRLVNMQQDLQNYAAQADKELSAEAAKMLQQVTDTIVSAMKVFNTPRKYHLILSNAGTDNILYADDAYDITKEFAAFLNARYVPSK